MNQGPSPVSPLQQFVAESLPSAAVLHSYLADLQWNSSLGSDKRFADLADNAAQELHHHAALWGALQRADAGDPGAWSSIGLNLARLLYRHRRSVETVGGLADELRRDPRGQGVLEIIAYQQRTTEKYRPLMLSVIQATGWTQAMG